MKMKNTSKTIFIPICILQRICKHYTIDLQQYKPK